MTAHNFLIFINKIDKTDQVSFFKSDGTKYNICYKGSKKIYRYDKNHIKIFTLQKNIDPSKVIVKIYGKLVPFIKELQYFGEFYKILYKNGFCKVIHESKVIINNNCLGIEKSRNVFNYFKEIARAIGISSENGNLLHAQYERINTISDETVLSCYLNPNRNPKKITPPKELLYPFGINESQKKAVQNAFSSQITIVQGPPGTGKTQTILNIIANAVRQNKTVAVVSSNNSATHNVVEKLDKNNFSFLAAFLGNYQNKENFITSQTGNYPDMSEWVLEDIQKNKLNDDILKLYENITELFNAKNRIAAIEQEFLALDPEQHYFDEYYASCQHIPSIHLSGLSAQQILWLWIEFERCVDNGNIPKLLKKLIIWFRFNRFAMKLFSYPPNLVIPYLQCQYYRKKKSELIEEKNILEMKMADGQFLKKVNELTANSLRLLQAELAQRYRWKEKRWRFEKDDLWRNADRFNQEYPVILSTTHSIKGTLNGDYIYDYLIVDEASQVDLVTGVLALSCARNVVIVGDKNQLPNVLSAEDARTTDGIWIRYNLGEQYRYARHSLLSSAIDVWKDAPTVLLREHYRCHPKIINFCNQKFYDGQLIVMTKDHNEPDVLTIFRTVGGNHARGHLNQRQIDVIREEVLPRLHSRGYQSIGIIAPYRDQVLAMQQQLGKSYEIDTVHKFQGREKDAIVLTSVDNTISPFIDDPNMLNVAVSRAVKSLTIIMSQNPDNDKTNYGDLARYIQFNNYNIINSNVRSIFDLLYKDYAIERCAYLKKYKRISEYESENLIYSIIIDILKKEYFLGIGCASRVSLVTFLKNFSELSADEKKYAYNPLTHTDFLLFYKMDKLPLLAIEVDGVRFHSKGSRQSERDAMKNRIFEKCGISLLRLRTDGSGEQEKIENTLKNLLGKG